MLIDVKNLAGGRAGMQLFEGLSFSVQPGEALRIAGPNGTGKSTLLRILAGLTPPVSGQIDLPPETALFTGHSDGLKSALSTRENLTFWAGIFGLGAQHGTTAPGLQSALEAALARFELVPLAKRRVSDLSAGQRRRVSLARLALSARPLWCLDEPTTALDPEQTARFEDILSGHLAQGGGAIIVSHAPIKGCAATLDLNGYRARRALPGDPFAAPEPAAGGAQ